MRSRSATAGYYYPTSNFVWAPMPEAAVCPRRPEQHKSTCGTLYLETAECCGFDDLEGKSNFMSTGAYHYADIKDRSDSYRCFQCPAPARGGAAQPLLSHDPCLPGFHHCTSAGNKNSKGWELIATHGTFCDRDADCLGDEDNCFDGYNRAGDPITALSGCVTAPNDGAAFRVVSVGLAVTTQVC
jgi:hypothetical protein